jgi:purine/pyrimidine-nucleoside phosphorylase
MFKINDYYDGNVKSIAFKTPDCPATIGVLAPGEYEFGTSMAEHITVISGKMSVLLPGELQWKEFKQNDTFVVPKEKKFFLKIAADTAYLCLYR